MGDLPCSPIIALIFTLLALISIHRKDRKKNYNYIISNKKYIRWNSYVTSDVGGTYHWKETSVGALTIINWISATLSITGHRGNLHEKENNEVK